MKKIITTFVILLFAGIAAECQNGIYIPTKRGTKPTPEELANPSRFDVVISFDKASSKYSLAAIDILDSVFNLAFSAKNPRFYKLTINGYDDGDLINEANNTLAKDRAEGVYRYFTLRCKEEFLVRTAANKYYNSCSGSHQEMIKYRVPVDFNWVSLFDKPEKERKYGNIPLAGKVLMTFEDDVKACLGEYNSYYIPQRDTAIKGAYSSVMITKGAFEKILNTKNEFNFNMQFSIDEHWDYKSLIENYFLIPHERQIMIPFGYVVLKSNLAKKPNECKEPLEDSIFVRFPVTEDQAEGRVRIIGKVYSEKGVEYKALKSKKIKTKLSVFFESPINATQIDTIFLGKRITQEEISDYFYNSSGSEQGAFRIKDKYYKAYKLDKRGEYQIKKPLLALFRISEEEEAFDPFDLGKED